MLLVANNKNGHTYIVDLISTRVIVERNELLITWQFVQNSVVNFLGFVIINDIAIHNSIVSGHKSTFLVN